MSTIVRMMLALLLGVVLCSAVSPAYANDQLKPWVLLGGKVTMLVPQGMALMSESDKAEKYIGIEPPAYVLTNDDWSLNITFDLKKIAMKPAEVRDSEAPMRKAFSLSKINSSGVRKINGVEFVILDVDGAASDATVHNLIAMTSLDGRMLLISYNCVLDVDPDCGKIGPRLIESIVLNPKSSAK